MKRLVAMLIISTHVIAIGKDACFNLTLGSYVFCLGPYSGAELTTQSNVLAIGAYQWKLTDKESVNLYKALYPIVNRKPLDGFKGEQVK